MKSQIVKLLLLAFTSLSPVIAWCQGLTADPALSIAVTVASNAEQNKLKEIKNNQNVMIQSQMVVNMSLEKIRGLQKKTYAYLTNVSGAVENARDVMKAYDYTKKIYAQCTALIEAAKRNPQGILTTSIGTKRVSKIKEDMLGLYSYIAGISLNKKVLLNSAERLVITGQVVHGLQKIYNDLYILVYNVEALSFKDLPRLLFPEIYYDAINKKDIAERIISSW